jgi:hypothetical protein
MQKTGNGVAISRQVRHFFTLYSCGLTRTQVYGIELFCISSLAMG